MPSKAKLQEAVNVIQEAGVHLTKEEKAKTNKHILKVSNQENSN